MQKISIPAKDPNEVIEVVCDFTSVFYNVGDTIGSVAYDITVYSGTDPSPLSMLGATSISGLTTTQVVTGGVEGVIYKIVATAHSGTNKIASIGGYLAVVPSFI